MTDADKPKFLEALVALASLYSRELDEAAIMLYWDAVRHLSMAAFQSAVRHAAATAEHFPPPAVLAPVVTDTKHRAALAWDETLRLAARSSSDHSDPTAAEAMRAMGGGKALGQRPADDLARWGRKEFIETYCDIASQQQRRMLHTKPSAKELADE
jgi:hypothetical protein